VIAGALGRRAGRWLPLLLLLLLAAPAAAQTMTPPTLTAELSVSRIEVTTAFTGGEILVFGATERLIQQQGDGVIVLVAGPNTSMVVRQKINVLGFWINGPSARFNRIPAYWALASTRPVEQMLAEDERTGERLGLGLLQLPQLGARGQQFRLALRELKQSEGLWVDQARVVEVSGGRLFHVRLPLPSSVQTGLNRVQVMLVRDGRIAARQDLSLEVVRVGTAAWIENVARGTPLLYGVACVLLAAFAGWVGSVLFRRS
jgi:uncharacterized protein (TIGR02186 family)